MQDKNKHQQYYNEHFLEKNNKGEPCFGVKNMANFYTTYIEKMKKSKRDNPSFNFIGFQIFLTGIFGVVLYYVSMVIFLILQTTTSSLYLYLLLDENFYISASICAFIAYLLTTYFLVMSIGNQYTSKDDVEAGIQAYRQNLFKAKKSLNSKEFIQLVNNECEVAEYEVKLEKLYDLKDKN